MIEKTVTIPATVLFMIYSAWRGDPTIFQRASWNLG